MVNWNHVWYDGRDSGVADIQGGGYHMPHRVHLVLQPDLPHLAVVREGGERRPAQAPHPFQVRCQARLKLTISLLVCMVWWNYRLCVITEPGSVPTGWVSTVSAEGYDASEGKGAIQLTSTAPKP